jgi:hypothetical protein
MKEISIGEIFISKLDEATLKIGRQKKGCRKDSRGKEHEKPGTQTLN